VPYEVELGLSPLREEHLFGIADRDLAALDHKDLFVTH
jgi:hypothetical protein